jgi:hypothetical protein
MLVLHIGLPKTGTTFLQGLFRRTPDLAFVHRKMGERESRVCHALRHLARANRLLAPVHGKRVAAGMRELICGSDPTAGPSSLLISDEDISVGAGGFWRGAGARPQRLARRLASLPVPDRAGGRIRVLIGIRRQDQWLASRYAESSRMFPAFCQADFDRRMVEIADSRSLPGVLGWLDYHAVHRHFVAALGPDNVHVMPLERLARAPHETLAGVGRFLGVGDLAGAYAALDRRAAGRNALSRGENLWRLRRDGSLLRLDPEVQAALRRRFADSNRALAAVQPLDFET